MKHLIAAATIAAALVLAGCSNGQADASSKPDWEGLAAYLSSQSDTETVTADEVQQTVEDGGGWECDQTSEGFYLAQVDAKDQAPVVQFSFPYFICGADFADELLTETADLYYTPREVLEVRQAFDEWADA